MPIVCFYCLARHGLRRDDCQELKEPREANPLSRDKKFYICDLCAAAELIADLAGYSEYSVRKDIERKRKENVGKYEKGPNKYEFKPLSYFAEGSIDPITELGKRIDDTVSKVKGAGWELIDKQNEADLKAAADEIDQSFVEKKPEPEATPEDYITSLRKARRKLE